MEVKVYNGHLEKAMKALKKKLKDNGVFSELKKKRFYEKPSVKKSRKQKEARRRNRRMQRESY